MKKFLRTMFVHLWYFFMKFKLKFVWAFTKEKDYPVSVFKTPVEISYFLKRGDRYKADPSWRDPVYHPTRIQKRIEEERRIGDCDDHAIYWCTSLMKSGLAKKVWYAFFGFIRQDGSWGGHAVCVYIGQDDKMYWADYKDPRPVVAESNNMVPDKFEWVIDATSVYGKKLRSATMIEIERLQRNDTPNFGKARGFKPKEDTSVEDLRKK